MAELAGRNVTCANGMPGYVALPSASGRVPGVVILHERYGFVQHPRNVAERFAHLGMAGLAINAFFKCSYQDSLADGSKRFYVSDPESVDLIRTAIDLLRATNRVDAARIAVLGMCQTGRHPLVMAAEGSAIAAAVCWYGAGADKEFAAGPYYPKPLSDILARASCPVLGLFGDSDRHIPVSNVRRMRDILERHGKTFQINIFEDAPHGFLNETMPERYRHRQAEEAWQIQTEFLQRAFNGGFDATRAVQTYAASIAASVLASPH